MKIRSFTFLLLLLFSLLIFSCAGGPRLLEAPPEWVSVPPEAAEGFLAFRGEARNESPVLAKEGAIEDLTEKIISAMNLGDESRWSSEGAAKVNAFRLDVESAVRSTSDVSVLEGFSVVRIAGWENSDKTISYVVDISWDAAAFEAMADELSDVTGVSSSDYRDLEERAKAAAEQGNFYESALIWAKAAGVAETNGNSSGYRQALRQAGFVLLDLKYTVESVPEKASVGSRPETPIIFAISSGGKPLGNAEFVLTYPVLSREGKPAKGSVRISSDARGFIIFRPPEVRYSGTQVVTIAPSADPLLEYLNGEGDPHIDTLVATLETPKAEAAYEAYNPIRTIPTGILILETDLAGNPLESSAAADGLFSDLQADEFDVEIMDLDPREMIDRSEKALLRDLKADVRFSTRYDRVIFGTVSLESFEQDGDGYTVRVSGTLVLSDINRQVHVYRSTISKTSRAGNGRQAVNAAFRQLGRSFAAELIAQASE